MPLATSAAGFVALGVAVASVPAALAQGEGGHAASILSGGENINPIEVNPAKPIVLIVVQLALIIALARLLGFFFGKARQPRVVSEILAGILLGPTAFGQIPGFTANIFPRASITYLTLLSELGLCLFLFCVGMEADLNLLKRNFKPSMAVSIAGLAIPFAIGCGVARGLFNEFGVQGVEFTTFMTFIGTSSSITALPVLARILGELGLMQDRVGLVALAAGVVNDVIGWALLALSIALANAGKGVVVVYILLTLVGWMLFLTFACRPALLFLARHTGSYGSNGPTQNFVCAVLVLVLVSGFFCECIGISSIFGAFLVGLIIPAEFCHPLTSKIEDVVSCILVPLYFATSGLSTNLTLLNTGIIWAWTVCVIVCAFCGKFLGCALAARLSGFNWRESGATGSLMSAKGLIELIVLNQGLQAGIISETVFSIFVLEALLLTIASTPLTLLFYPARVRSSSTGLAVAPPSSDGKNTPLKPSSSSTVQPGALPFKPRTRFTVVLDQVESLGAAMVFAHLFSSSSSSSSTSSSTVPQITVEIVDDEGKDAGDLGLTATTAPPTGSSTPTGGGQTVDTDPDAALLGSAAHPAPASTNRRKTSESTRAISLTPLRLIELTDRTSSSLLATMSPSQLLATDPVIGLFRTFASLFSTSSSGGGGGGIKVSDEGAEVRVEKPEGWAEVVAKKAAEGVRGGEEGRGGVVAGWKVGGGGSAVGLRAGEGAVEGESMIPNPFSHLFPSSAANSPTNPPASPARPTMHHSSSTTFSPSLSSSSDASAGRTATFLRSLFRSSTAAGADVHLLLDLTSSSSSSSPLGEGSGTTELFVPFFGGPDDRAALEMAAQLVLRSGPNGGGKIRARVVVIEQAAEETAFDREVSGSRPSSEEGEGCEGGGNGEVDKLAKELSAQYGFTTASQQRGGATQTQTHYPTQTYATTRAGGLASETADSVLLSQIEGLFPPSSSVSTSPATPPGLTLERVLTAHPLRSLLRLLHSSPSPSSSLTQQPSRRILLTGRSRHSPALSHRLESLSLFSLAAKEGRLEGSVVGNKEVRVALGDVAAVGVLENGRYGGEEDGGRREGRGVEWVWVVQAGRRVRGAAGGGAAA